MHNSSVRSWSELKGDDFVVIGGYESGLDAAFNLSSCGKRCTGEGLGGVCLFVCGNAAQVTGLRRGVFVCLWALLLRQTLHR